MNGAPSPRSFRSGEAIRHRTNRTRWKPNKSPFFLSRPGRNLRSLVRAPAVVFPTCVGMNRRNGPLRPHGLGVLNIAPPSRSSPPGGLADEAPSAPMVRDRRGRCQGPRGQERGTWRYPPRPSRRTPWPLLWPPASNAILRAIGIVNTGAEGFPGASRAYSHRSLHRASIAEVSRTLRQDRQNVNRSNCLSGT